MKTANLFKNLGRVLISAPSVAGLQITSSAIRFLEFKPGSDMKSPVVAREASIRLPAGIIDAGKIKDKEGFVDALNNVYSRIVKKRKENINVILTISAGEVYVEAFNLPNLGEKNLREAVDLNLQMISPNPVDQSYYSWQTVNNEGGPIEILGAFVLKNVIDELIPTLEQIGFRVVAIEFSTLSLVRNLKYLNVLKIDDGTSYLVIKFTSDGLIFLVLRNKNLYFNYFRSWGELMDEKGDITIVNLTDVMRGEIDRILNFHNNRWGTQIKDVILIAPALQEDAATFIRETYPDFHIQIVDSTGINLHGVGGAALRGLVPRIEDNDINLNTLSTIQGFFRDQTISFAALWRNVVAAVGGFVVILFFIVSILLGGYKERVIDQTNSYLGEKEVMELQELQDKAFKFNTLVSLVSRVSGVEKPYYPLLLKLDEAIGQSITIDKLSLQPIGVSSVLIGLAPDQNSVIRFKNKLLEISEISEVEAPLSSIVPQVTGGTSFIINFKIKSLEP